MGRSLAARCCLVTLVVFSATSLPGASLHDQVDRLLKLADDGSYSSLKAAQEFYDGLPAKDKQDWRMEYAYSLVLANGHRFTEAGGRLQKLAQVQPNNLSVRRAQLWIDLMQSRQSTFLDELAALAKSIGGVEATKIEDIHKQTATFLGRAFAHLEGPAATLRGPKLPVAKVKAQSKQALKHEELQADFERGELEVSEQFKLLRDEVAAAVEEAAREQSTELTKKRVELDDKNQNLDEKLKSLKHKQAERVDATKKQIDRLTEKADELETALLDVNSRVGPLRTQRLALELAIQNHTIIDQNTGTVTVPTMESRIVGRYQTMIANVDTQLAELNAEANAIRLRMMALANQGRGAVAQHLTDEQKIAAEKQNLKKQGSELQRRSKTHANLKATGKNAETRAMLVQLKSFSTYDPLISEEERTRLLTLCKE